MIPGHIIYWRSTRVFRLWLSISLSYLLEYMHVYMFVWHLYTGSVLEYSLHTTHPDYRDLIICTLHHNGNGVMRVQYYYMQVALPRPVLYVWTNNRDGLCYTNEYRAWMSMVTLARIYTLHGGTVSVHACSVCSPGVRTHPGDTSHS